MAPSVLLDGEHTAAFIGGALGALTVTGPRGPAVEPTDLHHALLDAIVTAFDPDAPPSREVEPWPAERVVAALADEHRRSQLAHLVVMLELCSHPVPEGLEAHVESYLHTMGAGMPFVHICRDIARGHLRLLHADLVRKSYYTAETLKATAHGHLLDLVRSKLSYYGVGHDEAIARRWRALAGCPEGSWGRGVAEFYESHRFPFPGEDHGIYEIGAHHDWIHVLADYGTGPEGEIDTFAFIAATMDDPKGFVQLIFTLALFQNAAVDTVGGRRVLIARTDTLSDPGAAERLGEALWRAESCQTDVMGGVDHFAMRDEPLDGLRERWQIPPKRVPGPGWRD